MSNKRSGRLRLFTQRKHKKKKSSSKTKTNDKNDDVIEWSNILELYTKCSKRINELMQDPKNNKPYFLFFNNANIILDEYKDYCSKNLSEFSSGSNKNAEKMKIVEKMQTLAKKFVNVEIKISCSKELRCENCNRIMQLNNRCYVCNNCGHNFDNFDNVMDIPDTYIQKPLAEDSRIQGFEEFLAKFQGNCNTKLPDELFEYIRKTCLKYKINQEKISKNDLYRLLKGTKFSKYLLLINKIHFLITGIPPPDISKYESKILERVKILVDVYDKINKNRSSFLNKTFLLWTFLKNEGCPVNSNDFLGFKGRDSELESIEILIKAISKIKIRYPSMKWEIYPYC